MDGKYGLNILNILKLIGFSTYHPSGLKYKNSTWCSLCVQCFVRISEQSDYCFIHE